MRRAAIIVAGVTVGVSVALVFRGGDRPVRPRHPASVTQFAFTDAPLPPVTSATSAGTTMSPAEEPPTADAALDVFLSSIVEAKFDAYALLDAASLQRFPTVASWARAQADLVRPVGFEIGPSRTAFGSDGDVVEMEVTSTHRPSLDVFRGLVPGRSQSVWQVRREQDRWRVAAEPVSVRPILPPDSSAPDIVREWVSRLEACDRDGASKLQASTYLYGPAGYVGAPCERRGAWSVGDPVRLDKAPDPSDLVAAYGPGVGAWVRLVPVDGPESRFFAVVAPMGDVWQVAGVAVRG